MGTRPNLSLCGWQQDRGVVHVRSRAVSHVRAWMETRCRDPTVRTNLPKVSPKVSRDDSIAALSIQGGIIEFVKLKLAVAVAAALIALGLVVYTRLRLAHSVRPSEQSSSLSARQSVAPRLTAPQLSVSSPPVDPSTARL